jgi:hypothetical protein
MPVDLYSPKKTRIISVGVAPITLIILTEKETPNKLKT